MHGQVRPLDDATRAEIMAANDECARKALRVLALAQRDLPTAERSRGYTPENVERELTFLGLLAMMDPPRPEVAAAVATCRGAGIRMVMVTGDYGLTAESVARRVGMLVEPHSRILTGAELEAMSDPELQATLDEEVVLARMAPEHKLRLVAAFQARGEVVAVTGDGVNDAPALRKADIGIVMGVSGTEVAKEAADVILTNDNFAALVDAIEEGRAVYDNIRRFITYIFASNVPEVVPLLLAALARMPLALTVAQMLAIDMGTDVLPALALGTERPDPGVMSRPPRRRGQSLLDTRLLLRSFLWLGGMEALLCYVGFALVFYGSGYTNLFDLPRADLLPYAERLLTDDGRVYVLASTVFHAGVVAAQIGNLFACRGELGGARRTRWLDNRFLLFGLGVEALLILLMNYVRPLSRVFEHLPLPPVYWLGLILYAPALYGLEWIRQRLVQRLETVRGLQRQGGAMT
jgi:magnesium-transporting ATPase (P-type)